MLKSYISIIFFSFCFFSFSQEEASFLGDWYLHYRLENGIGTIPPLTEEENYDIVLSISVESSDSGSTYKFESYGPSTTTFEGHFEATNDYMQLSQVIENQDSCNHPSEVCDYFSDLNNDILFNPNTSTGSDEYLISYDIIGTYPDNPLTTLMIYNEVTGDYAIYGRQTNTNNFNEIVGNWYLNEIMHNGVQYPNYYNQDVNDFGIIFSIAYTPFFYGYGACNSYQVEFGFSTNDRLDVVFPVFYNDTCENYAADQYEDLYFYEVIQYSSQNEFYYLKYYISGENENQELILAEYPNENSYAVFGRVPNVQTLAQTWFLSRIETPGNPDIIIPETDSPSLSITNEINPTTLRTTISGYGECNSFSSDYEVNLNNGNYIQLLDFSSTDNACASDYENAYFSILSELSTNYSEVEIINNGQNLILTDLLGARLVFNSQTLSIPESELDSLKISLKNNPVDSYINLSINQSISDLNYRIYSIDGKLINQGLLNSESINVEDLNSGLYFIRFSSGENKFQTIKFIKQ